MASSNGVPLGKRELLRVPGTFIAECLKEQGVEVAFGVHGGHIWQITDEMSNHGIKMITVRHEQAAVYAAEAYAKVTGKPGVAFATVGPGPFNMASAVQQAYLSCSPVILLLGGIAVQQDGTYTLQTGYAEDWMKGLTKWTMRLTQSYQIKHLVTKAFKDALAYPQGPVALEFSSTIFTIPVSQVAKPEDNICYVEQWNGADTSKPIPVGGAPELVEKAVKLVYESERPVMFAADGVHWSEGWDELLEFAELAQIPTTGRRIARGAIPEVHPLFVSNRVAGQFETDSDLYLTVGQKTGFFEGYAVGWPKCIQINESPVHIWTFVKTAVAIVGSPKIVLRQMIDYAKAHKLKVPAGRAEWTKKLHDAQDKSCESMQTRAMKYKDCKPIHHGYLSKVFWDYCEERYGGMNRVVLDGFTISNFAANFIRARYSGQVMDSSEHAGIGHGIGMVIGAGFGDPEMKKRPMVALMGDAGIGLAGMDIETAARYRLPIVYLVTNNNGWLTGRRYNAYGAHNEALGSQDREWGLTDFLPDIRYDKMFEEMGCHGEWVTEPTQIRHALDRAFTAAEGGKPAVVNIKVDPSLSAVRSGGPGGVTATIPWERLSKHAKALRRQSPRFPWDELGIPKMPVPDPWDPIPEERAEP